MGVLIEALVEKLLKGISYFDTEEYPALMEAIGITYATNAERPKKLIDFLDLEKMPEEEMLELLVQGLRTLSEYVQGPVVENQVELANARVTLSVMSLLEFLGCYFWKNFLPEQNA